MHKERLEHLKQTLLNVKARDEAQGHSHFNMDNWANSVEVDCMTVCCALGWECTTLEAQAQGLKLVSSKWGDKAIPVYTDDIRWTGFEAGAKYFDIEYETSEKLFAPINYVGDHNLSAKDITIDQVIRRIDCLLIHGEKELCALAEAEALEYKTAHLKLLEDKETSDA